MPNVQHSTASDRIVGLLFAMLSFGCTDKPVANDTATDERIMTFDSTTVRLVSQRDTVHLSVELAITAAQKTMGLMERRHLPAEAGMLFVYDSTQPPDAGFWMFRTRLPLDIAFMDSTGVVRATRKMLPCETALSQGCPTYAPQVPYRYALEVNAGFFERHGIGVGSALVLGDLPPSARHASSR